MPHPKPHEIIPIGTVCWWQRDKSKPAIKVKITNHCDMFGNFLNYEGIKQGQKETFAFYHDDLTPVSPPEQ
jgi:hypothetical protein